jgi:hypothetical protein
MTDASVITVLLTVIAVCAIVTAAVTIITAHDLRMVLHRVDDLLPDAEIALRDLVKSTQHARQILGRADSATEAIDQVAQVAKHASSVVTNTLAHFGFANGTGAEPRRTVRRNGRGRGRVTG